MNEYEKKFIEIWVLALRRGIYDLKDKEEYKDGFRIIFEIKNNNFYEIKNLKELCENNIPSCYPYISEILIFKEQGSLVITAIYFKKNNYEPPLVIAQRTNHVRFMKENR
jgi:hypothetical protein